MTTKTYTEKDIQELVDERVLNLLGIVDPKKIASHDKQKGFIYIGGEKADDARLSNLKAEAEFLLQSDIWHILCETPKELAHQTMFVKSESLDDLKKGKSMLYFLDTQTKILDIFKNYIKK